MLDRKYARKVNAGGRVLKPVVVIRGEVVGSWQRTIAKGRALVRPPMCKRVEAADWDAIEKAAAKYGTLIGVSAELAKEGLGTGD